MTATVPKSGVGQTFKLASNNSFPFLKQRENSIAALTMPSPAQRSASEFFLMLYSFQFWTLG